MSEFKSKLKDTKPLIKLGIPAAIVIAACLVFSWVIYG